MKILILTNNISGFISFRKEVAESFISLGHEVYLSAPEDRLSPRLVEIGVNVISTRIDRRGTNPIRDSLLTIDYFRLIKRLQPNIVLTYTAKPNIYGGLVCRMFSIPQIANITGLGTVMEGDEGVTKRILTMLYTVSLSKTRTVFFQNAQNMRFFLSQNIIKPIQSMLIPGSGVNLSKFKYLEYVNAPVIKFLYIGRLMKAKGIDELLFVAEQIHKCRNDVEFHLVGSFEDDYEQIIKSNMENGIVHYHGTTDDVRPFIEKCHCIIHPSYHEGMSNVILEGSASGRPIITTAINGCMEAVDNGVTGFLAHPRNAQNLLLQVDKFLAMTFEQRREMGIAARKKMQQFFDRRFVIKAYNNEINKLVINPS